MSPPPAFCHVGDQWFHFNPNNPEFAFQGQFVSCDGLTCQGDLFIAAGAREANLVEALVVVGVFVDCLLCVSGVLFVAFLLIDHFVRFTCWVPFIWYFVCLCSFR